MAKHDTPVAEKPTVEELLARVEELELREKKHWKIIENFLAKFGTYYNSEGGAAFFVVDKYVNAGANGVGLTPQQGLVEQFGLRIHMQTEDEKKGKVKTLGPCFVPQIIPEIEPVETFSPETAGGDNPQTVS